MYIYIYIFIYMYIQLYIMYMILDVHGVVVVLPITAMLI